MSKSGSSQKKPTRSSLMLNPKSLNPGARGWLSAGTHNLLEALQRFRSNMGLQGAEVRVRLDRRAVRETRCREVCGRSRDAEGDLSGRANAKTGPRGGTAGVREDGIGQGSRSRGRHYR